MKITIEGGAGEIAALVTAIQEQRMCFSQAPIELDGEQVSEAVQRYMCDNAAKSPPSFEN